MEALSYKVKERIYEALKVRRMNYPTDKACSVAFDLAPSNYSQIKYGGYDVLSDAAWITLARKLELTLLGDKPWNTAETKTFKFVTEQLKACQQFAMSAILCDLAGVGKSYAAKYYAKTNKLVVYIDCSQVKTKRELVKEIANQFGISTRAKYSDMYADLIYYINSVVNPLIILDEAGDLKYEAFLELKALWNACERTCGWYLMGADGLKHKIDRMRHKDKVGYAEIFDRFGKTYQRVSPSGTIALKEFNQKQAAQIIKANHPDIDFQKVYAKTDGSLRRIYIELQKLKRA